MFYYICMTDVCRYENKIGLFILACVFLPIRDIKGLDNGR